MTAASVPPAATSDRLPFWLRRLYGLLAEGRQSWRNSLRTRMLLLGLMPLLLAFPLVIGVLAWGGSERTDRLLNSTLRSNLAGAHNYLDQYKTQNSRRMDQLVRSGSLQDAVRQAIGPRRDPQALNQALRAAAESSGLDYLLVAMADGQVVGSSAGLLPEGRLPDSYVIRQARIGVTSSAYEQYPREPLLVQSPTFPDQLLSARRNDGSAAALAGPEHGLLINAAAHFPLSVEMPDAMLVGGVLLNHNHALIEHMRELIYPIGTLLDNSEGMTAIYHDGVSIAASLQRLEGQRPVGKPAAREVIDAVIGAGQSWLGVLQEDGQSHVQGFESLVDGDGRRIAMIGVGFPRAPYQRDLFLMLAGVSFLLAGIMLVLSVLFLRSGRALTSRLERIGETMKAVHRGEREARVVLPGGEDELAQLGRDFNELLDRIAEQDELQRRNQQTIASEAARRRALFQHARDGIVICDAQGRVVECNSRAAEMLGYGHDEMVGHYLHDWDACHGEQEVIRLLAQVDLEGSFYETAHQRRDGSSYCAEVSLSRAQWEGQTFVLVVQRDISERKAAAAELERYRQSLEARTAELAAANDAKSEFLANMSHELRTPMGMVIGLANLLLDTPLSAEQREYLLKIHTASTALLGVLNDILDYSKIEARLLQLESIPLRVDELLRKSTSLFEFEAQRKQLRLEVERAADLPELLQGDPLRLLQVLSNLIGNALKFTERGSIRVSVACLEQTPADALLRFAVTDTGVGIAPDRIGQLFAAFQQADASITRQYGGTGLGLSICKRLVELMGGEVGVDSRPGEGSTFWFTVRLGRVQPGAGAAHELIGMAPSHEPASWTQLLGRLAPIQGARVLVVDDNPTNLLVASGYLGKMGLQVETAGSGRQAIELAGGGRFDAILMDLQMPEMDGLTASRAIRARESGRRVPIIALTAAARMVDRSATLAAGMDEHVTKPIDPVLLADALLRWIAPDQASQALIAAAGQATGGIATSTTDKALDTGRALQALAGDADLLHEVLASFAEQFGSARAQLEQALALRQFDAAARLVHTISGLAPTLGADSLQPLARQFEAALQQQDGAMLADFCQALDAVLAAIDEWLRAADAAGPACLAESGQQPGPQSADDGQR